MVAQITSDLERSNGGQEALAFGKEDLLSRRYQNKQLENLLETPRNHSVRSTLKLSFSSQPTMYFV